MTWWNNLSDRWKRTLRTSFQTFVGVVITGVVALLAKAQDWVNGGLVDWSQELSNFGKVVGTALIASISGLVAYFMNKPSE